jgi:hypothetical protein
MARIISDTFFVESLSMCANSDKEPVSVGVFGELCLKNSWYGLVSVYLADNYFGRPIELPKKIMEIRDQFICILKPFEDANQRFNQHFLEEKITEKTKDSYLRYNKTFQFFLGFSHEKKLDKLQEGIERLGEEEKGFSFKKCYSKLIENLNEESLHFKMCDILSYNLIRDHSLPVKALISLGNNEPIKLDQLKKLQKFILKIEVFSEKVSLDLLSRYFWLIIKKKYPDLPLEDQAEKVANIAEGLAKIGCKKLQKNKEAEEAHLTWANDVYYEKTEEIKISEKPFKLLISTSGGTVHSGDFFNALASNEEGEECSILIPKKSPFAVLRHFIASIKKEYAYPLVEWTEMDSSSGKAAYIEGTFEHVDDLFFSSSKNKETTFVTQTLDMVKEFIQRDLMPENLNQLVLHNEEVRFIYPTKLVKASHSNIEAKLWEWSGHQEDIFLDWKKRVGLDQHITEKFYSLVLEEGLLNQSLSDKKPISSLLKQFDITDTTYVKTAHELYENIRIICAFCISKFKGKIQKEKIKQVAFDTYKSFGGSFILPSFKEMMIKQLILLQKN